jgi:hypothetical protein
MQIEIFEKRLMNSSHEIAEIAESYKQMFFCRPTEERIIAAFDLAGSPS